MTSLEGYSNATMTVMKPRGNVGAGRALNQDAGEQGSKFSWVPGSLAPWVTLRSLKSPTDLPFFSHDSEEVGETTSGSPLPLRIWFFPTVQPTCFWL